jgi:hypothetical protein
VGLGYVLEIGHGGCKFLENNGCLVRIRTIDVRCVVYFFETVEIVRVVLEVCCSSIGSLSIVSDIAGVRKDPSITTTYFLVTCLYANQPL